MSGTDPKNKWFRKGEPTEAFKPDGAAAGGQPEIPSEQLEGLPNIPGITLSYEIARGGMGVVYGGRQDFLDRRVAVKFLSVELGGASFAQRFQREAKILAGIKHPNIVACHTADTTEDGQSYLVMEFIDGPSLKAWLEENGPASPMASLRLIRASAQALAHAHQSDIIHRDVKPENILLETVTSTSIDINFPFTPKLVDLGLARMTHESAGMGLTSPGSVMGTPSTMSPEQFDDPDSVDFRSDIYGLGCCLYEMLVGAPAFRGTKLTDIVTKKREAVGPNPCDENAAVPPAVGALCQRLLASNREDRPASYKELDQLIEELQKAIVLAKTSPRTDTLVDVDKDSLDATMVSPPGPSAATRAPQPTVPQQPTPPKNETAPGMLNTGELDFLSAGGSAAGNEPPPPAFNEGGGTAPTQPSGDPQPKKTGLFLGIGAAVVIAAGVGVWMGMGPGEDTGGGNQNNNTTANNSGDNNSGGGSFPNNLPVVDIRGPKKVKLGERFAVTANARDKDGDKLSYQWTGAKGVIPLSSATEPQMSFRLDDGLPGVMFSVSVDVSDGIDTKTSKYQFEVDDFPSRPSLIGFKMPTSGWQLDDRGPLFWTGVQIAGLNDAYASCKTRGEPRTCSRDLGGQSYWEYSGSLFSMDDEDGYASLGLRFELSDIAYAVRCRRENDGKQWIIEVCQATKNGDTWGYQPLSEPCRVEWKDNRAVEHRARFAVRRVSDKLEFLVANSIQGATQQAQANEPSATCSLPIAADAKVRLTLFANRGIGHFRVSHR